MAATVVGSFPYDSEVVGLLAQCPTSFTEGLWADRADGVFSGALMGALSSSRSV